MVSALTGLAVRSDVAMTGEISRRGRVMPIGGLKEKTMAAYRHGVRTVIIPKENEKDLEEIDRTVRSALNFVIAKDIETVLDTALNRRPAPAATILQELPGDVKAMKRKPSIRQ
jgi:ATP-dependent Lon protease